MQISTLAREMPVSPIRNLTPLANEAKARGIDIIHPVSYTHLDVYKRQRLKQMFVAVLDNALRVSPEGGQVDIIYDQKKISITDEGPGIPPEVLPHLFERYYQGKDQGSSGLGLTISQAIAKKHGIRIEVNSEPGCTAFMFFLP